MRYIHSKNILLHSIIGIGMVFSLTTNSTVCCTLDKDNKSMGEINECINKLSKEVISNKEFTDDMNSALSQVLGIDISKLDSNEKYDYLQKFTQKLLANQDNPIAKTQVDRANNDSIIANSDKISECLDVINKNLDPNRNLGNTAKLLDKKFTKYHLKDRAKSLSDLVDAQLKNDLKNEDPKASQVFKDIAESMHVSETLFNDDSDYIKGQVVNGDGTPPHIYNTPKPIYDTPKRSDSVPADKVSPS